MAAPAPNEMYHLLHVTERGYASFSFKHVATEGFGTLEVEICDECHYLRVTCAHSKNTWDASGTILTCDFCGIDGT